MTVTITPNDVAAPLPHGLALSFSTRVARGDDGAPLRILLAAHTFENLVEMQHAANEAHQQVLTLRGDFGPPAASPWTEAQTGTYETAWRAWRDLARKVHAAITEHAKDEGAQRHEIEAEVKATAKAAWGQE